MKLFRKGSSGREVKDIQSRLVAAGFIEASSSDIADGSFGEATDRAVRAFQQDRGLIADGIVGPDTWRYLVEASRTFGCRFLYLREPPLRGDDVAELQRRLNSLGFYSGKEDGIFDQDTTLAVEQFQRNIGLPVDGIVGTKTVDELRKLTRVTKPTSVASIHESEKGLPSEGISGRRIMIDPGHGDPPDPGETGQSGLKESVVAESIADRLGAHLVACEALVIYSRRRGEYLTDTERASRANENAVELVISIHLNYSTDTRARGASTYYFASGNYRSPYGFRLANHIQDELVGRLDLYDCRTHGRAYPLLRETKMPVVIVEPAFISNPREETLLTDRDFLENVVNAICSATCRYFDGEKCAAEDT